MYWVLSDCAAQDIFYILHAARAFGYLPMCRISQKRVLRLSGGQLAPDNSDKMYVCIYIYLYEYVRTCVTSRVRQSVRHIIVQTQETLGRILAARFTLKTHTSHSRNLSSPLSLSLWFYILYSYIHSRACVVCVQLTGYKRPRSTANVRLEYEREIKLNIYIYICIYIYIYLYLYMYSFLRITAVL